MSEREALAEALCMADDTMYHHDRTDDYSCSACKATAQVVLDSPAMARLLADAEQRGAARVAAAVEAKVGWLESSTYPANDAYDAGFVSGVDHAIAHIRAALATGAAERVRAEEGRAMSEQGHTQTILATPELVAQGVYGNCMQAAIATVLRKPLDAVPHFGAFSWWPGALRLWLRGEGFDYTVVPGSTIPEERAMLCGKSPRGYAHAVVSEHGRIIWDPHPSRDGLTTITGAYVIHEWDPANTAPTPVDALMGAEHHMTTEADQ